MISLIVFLYILAIKLIDSEDIFILYNLTISFTHIQKDESGISNALCTLREEAEEDILEM